MASCPIVAIGASAGGLEAVSELLAALPSKNDMAYIVVQHLDPDHKSLLSELLSKKTAMPVVEAEDGVAVESSHVYVIPPNATLRLLDDHLRLTRRETAGGGHHPVDVLFASVAAARSDAAIGVVLSGADSDGALGVQAIKHNGGITLAQEPGSARFPSMPKSAIETGCVDFILRPSEIARELVRLGAHPYLQVSVQSAPPGELSEGLSEAEDEDSLRRVFRRLRTAHSVDFSHYKRNTLRRRLARRMALHKIDELGDYAALLDDDPAETAALYQDFLIRVTGFFRDPESFEGLRERILPSLCEGRSGKDPIRIWVPGCASGEEVYSITITLVEYLGDRLSSTGIQIFGTDVSEAAIEKARAGYYVENIAEEVSGERLQRFFVKQDSHYRIAKSIRDLCIFARQDVTRDPPFSRLDLVSCRNLLIYLDSSAQRRVMQVFHYALRPQGFLMLGSSESAGTPSDLFDLNDKHHRIYTRKGMPPRTAVDLGSRGGPYGHPGEPAPRETPIIGETDSVQREADRILLAQYAPASLLVDDALNILQFRGETGRYLEHASGSPSLNLQRVVRPELLVEISPALAEARKTGSAARRDGLCVDELTDVTLQVIPLKSSGTERCYLIVFEDASRRPSGRRAQQAASALPESQKDRRLAQLEREMASTRDYLQATMEEQEAVREELKSAHEEVLSANEEFQSTNEELETAKEELQSANEELTTTNDELRNRNSELSVLNNENEKARSAAERARAYADIIVERVRDPLLVLDCELKVLRVNQPFYAAFKTRPEDTLGRPVYALGSGQWNISALRAHLESVLARNETFDNYEGTHEFAGVGPRTIRLNARRIPGDTERQELILLTLEDVTERRAVTEGLRQEARRKDEFLATLAHELRNPLTPIMNSVRLLRHPEGVASATKLIDMIERQTRRLVRLVNELLDVARISRGLVELKLEDMDFAALVGHAVEASRSRMGERQHELSLVLPEVPVWVEGDPVRLEQVVANVLENAAKYTNPGGRIAVQLTQQDGEASLSVRDNGVGLAADMLEHVFDLFTQVDPSLERSAGGLGIGLTLVRRVLELHGGRIEAHSAGLGRGSEFIVHLPVLMRKRHESLPAIATVGGSGAPDTRARRILIVDDNEDSAESVALLARSWGHEAVVALDGPSALALAQQFHPELSLIDIGLPGINGYDLARRLRQELPYPDLYLAAVTGYGRIEDRLLATGAGFDGYFVKPLDADELRLLLASGASKPRS